MTGYLLRKGKQAMRDATHSSLTERQVGICG